MKQKIFIVFICIFIIFFFVYYIFHIPKKKEITSLLPIPQKSNIVTDNPLAIKNMQSKKYPGSEITLEKELEKGSNYNKYISSYYSDGLKIYALLTIPLGNKPDKGWPVIIFNHGYIPPEVYRTDERYIAYVDYFARNGYIVFKPDFRGNGFSEGTPEGAYYSPAYTIDVMNALYSINKFKDINAQKIGMWGHSMGGNISLRVSEITNDIKAVVIWGGVVGSYDDLMNNWQRKVPYRPSPRELQLRNRSRTELIQKYGTPTTNPTFWESIDPTANLGFINASFQLHHGLLDEEVPVSFSEKLKNKMEKVGKTVELYTYEGSDHNISQSFSLAMERSITFFDKYLKSPP